MHNSAPSQPTGLYVQTLGHGPDLVLLHGWGMHAGVWEDVVEALLDDYRITLLDLPGHGYSRLPQVSHTLAELTALVAAVTPSQATWIGWSLGGLIAQRLALDQPDRVQKLVLVSSSPCFVQRPDWPAALAVPVLHAFADGLSRDYRATLQRFLALEVHGSEHERTQLRRLRDLVFQHGDPDPAALGAGLTILENSDLRPELHRLRCPVLLLLGRRDNLVPAAAGTAIQARLADARLHLFERAAHAPFFSHLDDFITRLRTFLDE
jgi:pimeloyl-[acyl-carrier protein] methyl ester esterase